MFVDIFSIVIPFIYFLINIGWTQRIYNGKRLLIWIILSVLFPIILFAIIPAVSRVQVLNLSMIFFYYFFLLLAVKMIYKKVNNFIGKYKLVAKEFENKDFTYVHWNSKNPTTPHWWDEKRAKKPSWFDYALTLFLLTIPFLIVAVMYMATDLFPKK